jgi:hypothetical protein
MFTKDGQRYAATAVARMIAAWLPSVKERPTKQATPSASDPVRRGPVARRIAFVSIDNLWLLV